MEIITSLYTVQIISSISYSSVSFLTPNGLLSCSIECRTGCIAFSYNKQTSSCKLVTEFYTGTPPKSPTKFYMKNINCPVLDEYKYIREGTNKACIKFITSPLNWFGAQNFCRDDGGYLIQLKSIPKTNMIVQYIQSSSNSQWWIGFRDKYNNNISRWIDDEILDHFDPRWFANEPSFESFNQHDDCGVLHYGKFWDYNCINVALKFMCEKPV